MTVTVGIPRGLLYHEYGSIMRRFLESCGARAVVSPTTNREILEAGLALCVDDACLPVKAFFGHAAVLCGQVDALFVPRFISVERGAYICPKLMGLPDMIRARLRGAPPLIDTCIDMYRGIGPCISSLLDSDAGKVLGIRRRRLAKAMFNAFLGQRKEDRSRLDKPRGPIRKCAATADVGNVPNASVSVYERTLTVGVLGHPYNLADPYLSLNLLSRLGNMGMTAITADDYGYNGLRRWEKHRKGKKRVFWTTGRKLIGAAQRWYATGEVDGIIHLTSFGCGPESFIAEVIGRESTHYPDTPLIVLNVDEHSGEAGMATRLEAFADTIRMRMCER